MIKPLQSITLKNDNGEDTTYVVASAPAIVETTEPASVASFADGAEGIPVKSLIADINPVQNLNGQSAPYPAGGGKNFVAPFRDAEGTSSGLTMTPNADGSVRVHGTASNSSATLISMKSVNIPLPAGTYTFNIGITSSSNKVYGQVVTGAHIFFSRNAKDTFTVASDTTITRLDIGCNSANGEQIDVTIYPQLEVGSTATAYAPYSNICPITGWTGMNVVRNGFNQWDEQWELGYYQAITGEKVSDSNYIRSKNLIPTVPNATYYFKAPVRMEIFEWDADGGFLRRKTNNIQNTTFTTSADCYYVTFDSYVTLTTYNNDISINYPSTDHDYHAYSGTTYPISWADEAGTVYGGTLDVTTGLLTVTQEILTINDVSWNYYTPSSGNPYFYHTEPTKASVPVGSSENPLICSILPYGGSNYAGRFTDGKIWQAANTNIYIVDTSVTTVSAMKTKYGTGTVVFPLATPQTYQLTPQAVMTILGQNNIWADTGDVEVAYCADTKMYIDKVIAAL